VPAILWIGNPASLRGVENSIRPSLDIEREPVHIDVTGGNLEAPVVVLVEVDVVQAADDDL